MYTIDKFFCTSLENGANAYGWFSIIFSIIIAAFSLFQAQLSAIFWYTILGVGSGVLLIIATKKRSHYLLLPWLGVNALYLCISTPISFVSVIWNHASELGVLFGALLILVLLTLVIGYGWIGVYSLYFLFKNEKEFANSSSSRGVV